MAVLVIKPLENINRFSHAIYLSALNLGLVVHGILVIMDYNQESVLTIITVIILQENLLKLKLAQ
jgi:hypothetical protein